MVVSSCGCLLCGDRGICEAVGFVWVRMANDGFFVTTSAVNSFFGQNASKAANCADTVGAGYVTIQGVVTGGVERKFVNE